MALFDIIRIERSEMKQIRSLTADQRERTTQLYQRLNDQLQTLKSDNWVGENADKFYSNMDDELMPAIERLVKAFSAMEDACGQLEQIFNNGEEEASSFFAKS